MQKTFISVLAAGAVAVATTGCGGSGVTTSGQLLGVQESIVRLSRARQSVPHPDALPKTLLTPPQPVFDSELQLWHVDSGNPSDYKLTYYQDQSLTIPAGFYSYLKTGSNIEEQTEIWIGPQAGKKKTESKVVDSSGFTSNFDVSVPGLKEKLKGKYVYNSTAKGTDYELEFNFDGVRILVKGVASTTIDDPVGRYTDFFEGKFEEVGGVTMDMSEETNDRGVYKRRLVFRGSNPLLPANGSYDRFGNGKLTFADGSEKSFTMTAKGIKF